MAHKAKSYYLGATKKGDKFIVLYDNVEPSEAEQKMIDRFIGLGYDVRFEEKKTSLTIAEMEEELKASPEKLAEFKDYYSGKKKMYKEDGTEMQSFFAACKIYQQWKKEQKKTSKKK